MLFESNNRLELELEERNRICFRIWIRRGKIGKLIYDGGTELISNPIALIKTSFFAPSASRNFGGLGGVRRLHRTADGLAPRSPSFLSLLCFAVSEQRELPSQRGIKTNQHSGQQKRC